MADSKARDWVLVCIVDICTDEQEVSVSWRKNKNESGPAPRGGGIPGPCPLQMSACAPPSEDCAPEEINRLGATGVQIEA